MALYEHVFMARQDLSEGQVTELTEKFAAVIKENGGKIEKEEYWGLRTLAYKVKKNRKAHYVLFNIDAPAATVQEMERQMRINEDILRHMTIKVEELEKGPSVMMKQHSRGEAA